MFLPLPPRLRMLFSGVILGLILAATVWIHPGVRHVDAALYTPIHRAEDFLMEALLQVVVVDVTGDGAAEVLLSGRNYETREKRLYLLRWLGGDFQILWRSENLFESASHLAVAVGHFRAAEGLELAVLTDRRIRLFAWDGDGLRPSWSGANPLQSVAEVTSGSHPDHPGEVIVLTQVERMEPTSPVKGLSLLVWKDAGFTVEPAIGAVGNVRALSAGDLTGDGFAEIVLEEGRGTRPGTVQVWQGRAGGYQPIAEDRLRAAAAFGLAVAPGSSGRILVADDTGRLTRYDLDGSGYVQRGEAVRLGWALVDVSAGDLQGNGEMSMVVIGYPSRLYVLARDP